MKIILFNRILIKYYNNILMYDICIMISKKQKLKVIICNINYYFYYMLSMYLFKRSIFQKSEYQFQFL